MHNCKNSELYLQKFCYLESAFEVDFAGELASEGAERGTIVGLAALGGLVRRRGLVGGEVEFENPVPLRKGSARVRQQDRIDC